MLPVGEGSALPCINRIYQNIQSTCHPEPWKNIGEMVHKEVEGSFREAEFLLLRWENRRPTKTCVSPSARILRMFLYTYQYRSPAQDDTLNLLFGYRVSPSPHPNRSGRRVRPVFSLISVHNHERLCTRNRTRSSNYSKKRFTEKFLKGF